MFSKYRKPDAKPDNTAAAPKPEPKTTAPADTPEASGEPPKATRKSQELAAVPKAQLSGGGDEKEAKRRQRLDELKTDMHHRLLDNLNLSALETAKESELRAEINAITSEQLADMGVVLNREDRQMLNVELFDEVTGLGPLEPLLKDDTVNDILVNGPNRVFVERAGRLELTDVRFKDERHLLRIIDKIVSAVGRRVDESNPYVDARLKPTARVSTPWSRPIAVDGSLVSIRKFKKEKLGVDDLVSFGAFSEEMAAYLQAAVATRLNVIVSGGTGSGKTTTLNALSSFIDNKERDADDRGHRGTSASADPRGPDGKPPAQRRGQGRGHAARLSEERAPDASRPHHRRRDARRGSDRHAAGHEHRPRRVDDHDPRQQRPRRLQPSGKHDRHGRHRDADQGGARPDRQSAVNLIVQASRLQDGSRRMVSITEMTGMEGEVISMQEVFRFQRTGLRPTARSSAISRPAACARTTPNVSASGATTCRPIYEPVAAE
jgi:pilus assembly protein CpaF